MSTLLERTKGSALDIIIHHDTPAGVATLISPRAQQIRCLEFRQSHWQDIVTFSKSNSGRFPLLRTLKIISPQGTPSRGQPNVVTPPSLSLFRRSVNLEKFVFHSRKLLSLDHFIFPNLTTFILVSHPGEEWSVSHLLDFLKGSPMLQTVKLKISSKLRLWDVPEETVAILPKVETFSLHVVDDHTALVYGIAAHISCPCARYTSLMHERDQAHTYVGLQILPTFSWDQIVHQYAASPLEEVTLKIKGSEGCEDIECSLTFRSSDATVIRLGVNVNEIGVDNDLMPPVHMGWEIFCQALTTIHLHPQRSHLKRLHIKYIVGIPDACDIDEVVLEVEKVFSSLEPLDELTIHGCDLRVFLSTFLKELRFCRSEPPIVFRQVKQFTILDPLIERGERRCIDAIVELARLQHTLGIPFERMTVRMWDLPIGMEEELRQWVGVVDCRQEEDGEEYI